MGMLDQVKQAMQMRKEAKRIQSEIEKITYEYANGGITCVATPSTIRRMPRASKPAIKASYSACVPNIALILR